MSSVPSGFPARSVIAAASSVMVKSPDGSESNSNCTTWSSARKSIAGSGKVPIDCSVSVSVAAEIVAVSIGSEKVRPIRSRPKVVTAPSNGSIANTVGAIVSGTKSIINTSDRVAFPPVSVART